ncbi:hypothetical protein [Bacillus sp. OTU530]|uniref:hypothetical protein n=1 Tax=Bacillus sp. OTU530 TaxID=3043862 RepID=UPI00313E5132
MLKVCEKHIKKAIEVLNVPHIQRLSQKYQKHTCVFCGEPAHFRLFYSIPIENSLFKIRKPEFFKDLSDKKCAKYSTEMQEQQECRTNEYEKCTKVNETTYA